MDAEQHKEMLADADRRFLENLPDYPWLPCPICHGVEGCDHTVPERAKAFNPAIHMSF